MSLPIIFRAAALADIQSAYQWYEDKRQGLGASFMAEIETTQTLISDNPDLFAKVRGPVHRAILRKFPYGVFYIVRPEFVSIIAVMHHARIPDAWQHRK